MASTATAQQNLSSGDERTMSERLEVAVARLEEKMDAVKGAVDENAADRKAQAERLSSLERQQERHADATSAVLGTINRQLGDFITDAKRRGSASDEVIQTLSGRIKPLEEDLRSRLEKEAEGRRRAAENDRNVRRLRNGVGLVVAVGGGLYAAKDGLHNFMKWLAKLVA